MDAFDWGAVLAALPFLWDGMQLSLLLLAVGMLGGTALGLLVALLRLFGPRLPAAIAAAYVDGLRAIPLVLVLFWFYFLVPLVIGRPVGALPSALIAFVIFEAAYYSEIIRAGIGSVRSGQWQAAQALGMTRGQTLRLVVLPQALRAMLPVLVTQAVILFQDTSLVYVIGLRDFMTATSISAEHDGRLVEFYVFAALVYLTVCSIGTELAHVLQRRRSA
jgi:glutamate/aspartate transport system permease protein